MILRSLFAKIFAWFWVTMIAVAVATAMAGAFLHNRYGSDRFEAHFSATQSAYAEAASAILETEGLPALERWLHQLRGPGGLPGRQLVFAPDGQTLFGGRGAEDLKALVKDANDKLMSPMPIDRVFFEPIYSADGERYWFVSDMRFRRPGTGRPGPKFAKAHPHRLPALGAIIAVAILVSGIVCYILARYLTRPIRQLQIATKQIAGGDFETRVNRDIAPRNDELGELSRDFDEMAEKLSKLQKAQAELVRDVSHELRSPLARLQVALGLAEQRDDGRSSAELKRIEQELSVLEELISQLLSVARLDAVNEQSLQENFDLSELLAAICTDANYEGKEDNKAVSYSPTGEAIIKGDPSSLRSAFENIIRNALRHTADSTKVEVSLTRASPNNIEIRVRDAGPGVPESKLDELFKPFVRVEPARDRDSGGFGIGLAIASSAVRAHQGKISARNVPGGGLEVLINLPVQPT